MKLRTYTLIAALLLLTGCAGMIPTSQTEEAFVVFDVQGANSVNRGQLLEEIKKAVQTHHSSVNVQMTIPQTELPLKPQRLNMINNGLFSMPSCPGSIMTLTAHDQTMAKYGDASQLYVCVFPYQLGYSIDVRSIYRTTSGMIDFNVIGKAIGQAIVGETSQFIPRTMNEIRKAAISSGGVVKVVDSYIPQNWRGPLVDELHSLAKK